MPTIKPAILVCLLFFMLSVTGHSSCTKEDVEFYLDKGFTQEQITQLCSKSSAEIPDYTPYQQKVIIYQEGEGPGIKDGFTYEERKAIRELEIGTDVVNLVVDQDSIQFTVRVCLAIQEGTEYSQRYRTCPEVFYKVMRAGLKAIASGKQFGVFGQSFVTIQGVFESQAKQDFDDYPAKFRPQLKRYFNWKTGGDKTRMPVRANFSTGQNRRIAANPSQATRPRPSTGRTGCRTRKPQESRTRY